MNTLIFQSRSQPKIHLEGETLKKTEVIVEDKSIEQIKEKNIASRIKKIDVLWNNGINEEKEEPKQWKKETFITHLNKKGVRTDNREIKNYIAEKFSISDRDFLDKINQAKERKKEEDLERIKYIDENSDEVNEGIKNLFKKTQEIEEEKQKAKRILKSTPETGRNIYEQRIKNLEKQKDKLKKDSSELIKKKEKLQKMQAEVANPSFLPNLNELLQASGKHPFSKEAFNRKMEGYSANMDPFFEELEQSKKERKEEEIAKSSPSSEPSMHASSKSSMRASSTGLKSSAISSTIGKIGNVASKKYVRGQGGADSGRYFLSKTGDGDGEEEKKRVQRSSTRKITPIKKFDPSSTKPSQSSKAKVPPGFKGESSKNSHITKKEFPVSHDDDDNDWEDVDEEQEQEENSSERKEPKFIEPEVEEAFEFSSTINSENKTIIRNIIKNLNGILSAPILSLSTGSKSDIKHVNNVIIYDEIREGEERLKKMSEDSIYIPKYIPQLPSEQ
jgi:hypothetical protein